MNYFLPSNKPPKRWLSPKTKQIMRLSSVLLISLTLQMTASVSSQNVSFKGKNLSARKVLSIFKEQSNYVFFYERGLLKGIQPINIELQNATVENALDAAFGNEDITWNIVEKTVFFGCKKKWNPLQKLKYSKPLLPV